MNNSIYEVINNDYCIGCGGCAYASNNFSIGFDLFGMYKASFKNNELTKETDLADKYCPFSDKTMNEDQISNIIFKDVENKDINIGRYIENFVGYVQEEPFRSKGSSGGYGKWILNELLQKDEVDYVVQIKQGSEIEKLFDYEIFKKGDDVLSGSRSAYYPVTLNGVLDFVLNNKGRYVITALPCFAKVLRNIALNDEIIGSRIKHIIGIVCGHLKSKAFAELMAWQMGVKPENLRIFEFRDKIKNLAAIQKGVYAIDKQGNKTQVVSSKTLYGGNWGHGLFKYKACDYCDDVFGETADVSVGDAWLNEYINDSGGNNVLVIRNQRIFDLTIEAVKQGRLNLIPISVDEIVLSQAGGLRNRREGLLVRLERKKAQRQWTPKKRYFPISKIEPERKRLYIRREKASLLSHKLFKKAKLIDDLHFFLKKMKNKTGKLDMPSLKYRIENKLYLAWQHYKKLIKKVLNG